MAEGSYAWACQQMDGCGYGKLGALINWKMAGASTDVHGKLILWRWRQYEAVDADLTLLVFGIFVALIALSIHYHAKARRSRVKKEVFGSGPGAKRVRQPIGVPGTTGSVRGETNGQVHARNGAPSPAGNGISSQPIGAGPGGVGFSPDYSRALADAADAAAAVQRGGPDAAIALSLLQERAQMDITIARTTAERIKAVAYLQDTLAHAQFASGRHEIEQLRIQHEIARLKGEIHALEARKYDLSGPGQRSSPHAVHGSGFTMSVGPQEINDIATKIAVAVRAAARQGQNADAVVSQYLQALESQGYEPLVIRDILARYEQIYRGL